MNAAPELLHRLRERGLEVLADGGELVVRGRPAPSPAEVAELRARKAELLEALQAESVRALVLDVAPGRTPEPGEVSWVAFEAETAAQLEVMEKRYESFALPVMTVAKAGLSERESWVLRVAAAALAPGCQRAEVKIRGRRCEVLERWPAPGPMTLQ